MFLLGRRILIRVTPGRRHRGCRTRETRIRDRLRRGTAVPSVSTTPILLEENSKGVSLYATPEPQAIEASDFHDPPPLALRWKIGN